MITTANCPSCGGPITFKVGSSIVVVCEFCGSAVARTDRDVRNLGKVADLIDTQSPLRVGLEGRFENRPFTLTGRVQIGHQAGGVWDEWYAAFADGWWGWLAEAQGKFYMTFFKQVPNAAAIPPVGALQPGQPVAVPGEPTRFVVGETGVGRVLGAKGEIPYAVQPGLEYAYADLSGPGGAFATLDYRQPRAPVVFLGREVTLKDLGVSAVVDEFDAEKKRVGVAKLACPHCNGPLELRVPDASLRVTCPNCNALLDVNRGNLSFLRTLEQGRQPRWPLGSVGNFDLAQLTLVGFMVRACQVEGEWYPWEEYLLYEPSVGFRWLVNGEGGWYFVETVSPGDVEEQSLGRLRFGGKRFHLKEAVDAVVQYVRGEFYWRVEIGETTQAADYYSRNETMSKEVSGPEVNFSFGRAMSVDDLDRAFDPRKAGPSNRVALPPPRVVVPPKPLPPLWLSLLVWALLSAMAIGAWVVLRATSSPRTVVHQSAVFPVETAPPRPPEPAKPDPESVNSWVPGQVQQTVVVGSFQLAGYRNLAVDVKMSVPSYGKLSLKLVNDATGEVREQKVDTSNEVYSSKFAGPPPGSYTLYAVHKWVEDDPELVADVALTEGVNDLNLPVCLPLLLLIVPGLLLIAKALRAMSSE